MKGNDLMIQIKTEKFNGKDVRFVQVEDQGEWLSVGKDLTDALGYKNGRKAIRDHVEEQDKRGERIVTPGGEQQMTLITEFGVDDLIFNSHLPNAREFKRWVYGRIKDLRETTGLKQYQMLKLVEDKDIQKQATTRLQEGLGGKLTPSQARKAASITNKCVANVFGLKKAIPKPEMNEDMLLLRQKVYDDVCQLMIDQHKYSLDDIHISKTIYRQYENYGKQDKKSA